MTALAMPGKPPEIPKADSQEISYTNSSLHLRSPATFQGSSKACRVNYPCQRSALPQRLTFPLHGACELLSLPASSLECQTLLGHPGESRLHSKPDSRTYNKECSGKDLWSDAPCFSGSLRERFCEHSIRCRA